MKINKFLILAIIILLIFVVLLVYSICIKSPDEDIRHSFYDLIQKENFEDITLKIYYKTPKSATRYPWEVDDLKQNCDSITVVQGEDLREYINLFYKIDEADLEPVKERVYLNARVYCVIESKVNGKLMEFALWGSNGIYYNGKYVEGNKVFYDAIIPFLSDGQKQEFEDFVL